MIRLMIIACTNRVRCVTRDSVESLPSNSTYFIQSGYGGGQTTACIGSLFVAHDVAQLADSCTFGTLHFSIPVLAVDHGNAHSHPKPS